MRSNLERNPYLRNEAQQSVDLPLDNPIRELKEDELLKLNGAKSRFKPGAEVAVSTWGCYVGSVALGNDGFMCTTTVECQNQCK
ncbi:plantaricin C family lantibiotic [Staphylococcus epidermidis]|uniref:plantaricin C family lantibiotic n=1 Tax=Staphylococcus epidermidis TaxID=1282 RepID=UPI00066C1466|nr:plantaricin C family lantibiotic [Staphylococcus epidermidis]MCG7840156.1 plantaricin C family lantibiotic [Staphylococcus epidermidis]MCG7843633.1 plantaricin C family lantibiotic [Staphylococcus epidermidis]